MVWKTGVFGRRVQWVALSLGAILLTVAFAVEGEMIVAPKQTGVMSGKWHFSNGPEFPGASGELVLGEDGALHLEFDFTGGGAYVAAYCDLDAPARLKAVSVRVRKPEEAQLTVRATASDGQTFQKSVFYAHSDWQRLSFDMRNWSGHWGGPDDGAFRQPVSMSGILVESNGLESLTGEVLIADVTGEEMHKIELPTTARGGCAGDYVVTDFGDSSGFGPSAHSTLRNGVWAVDFAKTDAASLHHSLSLFGKPGELSLKLRGGAKGNILKMALGSHFQVFERIIGTLDGGEQTFTFPMPPEEWNHYGGENDGRVRYPLRIIRVSLERGEGPAGTTEVELIELRCATDVSQEKAITLLSNLTETGATSETRTLEATCIAWNLLDKEVSGTLTLTVRDWEDNVLDTRTAPWTLPAKGLRTELTWAATAPARLNFADAEFRFDAEDGGAATTRAGFTRPLEDEGDATLRPESPWGMGVYLYRYPDNPEGHALMDRAASMAQAAGVKWSREEFSWSRIETKPGEYNFDFYDVVVDTARRHGIRVYGLLAYWSRWTEPYTEQGIDDFCKWARATVRHFKDRVKHWEIYNEPNIFFWSGPRELYPVLMKKCYAAIKEEDPEAEVLAISTAGIDRAFIQRCLDADAPFDILTIHPYRGWLLDAKFMRELENVADMVGGRPVWITEMGWSTQIGATDERTQAQLLARCYLSAVASGACQNVSWYDFRNDGTDPFYNEANFGTLRRDLTPKPSYRALATVCRTLAEGEPRARHDEFGDGVCALEMGDALALWSPAIPAQVACRVGDGQLKVLNLMGDELAPQRDGKSLTIELRPGSPVFLTGAKVKPRRGARLTSKRRGEEVIHF